ncbi:MAG: ATP-binding protein [Nannocystaceae bacterium]|nr:ATP-binding protein [Nannocystaceae bacterium]
MTDPVRIVLIGAESTGKSTLASALADARALPQTGEFVRTYVEQVARPLREDDLDPIARGQLAEEDRHTGSAAVLHDTNALSTLIYARHYFGVTQAWLEQAFTARHYAVYLFCQPDIPWTPDPGQRDSPEARDVQHALFDNALRHRGLPTFRIEGDETTRLRAALNAVDAVLR